MKVKSESDVAQSFPTPCDPIDGSLPGSSIHGIFQVRVLEWVAFPSSEDLRNPEIEPGSPTLQADSLPPKLPGGDSNGTQLQYSCLENPRDGGAW